MAAITGGKHLKEMRRMMVVPIRTNGKHLKEMRSAWISTPWRPTAYGGGVSIFTRR